jgi:GxxExxY protein
MIHLASIWWAAARHTPHASANASPRRHEGTGLLESVYEVALCRELLLRKVAFERQLNVPVHYKGESLNCQVKLDLLVTGNVIVEVKAVEKLLTVHRAQLLTYLRLQGLWLGLLINFNVETLRHGVRRVLNG